jgi:hypothetical protein
MPYPAMPCDWIKRCVIIVKVITAGNTQYMDQHMDKGTFCPRSGSIPLSI